MRERYSNAFTASSSVTGTYFALPVSLKLACSGPIPGSSRPAEIEDVYKRQAGTVRKYRRIIVKSVHNRIKKCLIFAFLTPVSYTHLGRNASGPTAR